MFVDSKRDARRRFGRNNNFPKSDEIGGGLGVGQRSRIRTRDGESPRNGVYWLLVGRFYARHIAAK